MDRCRGTLALEVGIKVVLGLWTEVIDLNRPATETTLP